MTHSDTGLFKMFSHWIFGTFNIKIQSERGHKFVYLMGHININIDVYQCSCGSFCVSLLTDKMFKRLQ